MAKKKFKTPDDVLRDLTSVSNRLPRIPKGNGDGKPLMVQTVKYGSELLEQGLSEVDGKRIIPGKKYITAPEQEYVDHLENLQQAYQDNGQDGVQEYCDNVKAQFEALQSNSNNSI